MLHWELTELGVKCEVVAPTLVSVKAGHRVKMDGRDALKLARSCRAGDLTAVSTPVPLDSRCATLVFAGGLWSLAAATTPGP